MSTRKKYNLGNKLKTAPEPITIIDKLKLLNKYIEYVKYGDESICIVNDYAVFDFQFTESDAPYIRAFMECIIRADNTTWHDALIKLSHEIPHLITKAAETKFTKNTRV